ncbi:hypothetical protein CTAYLR_003354 [Chrysophaeum taylorii]|uniref:UBA domain-containing protein n=1 Tax=Chrysophaeum taylorii TaxID=2483200 RepID=A0AAD7UFF8_9STRA|nr:hypothetical protein CTAYLR_003354 [Chrysophaeum taylorii]
MVEEDQVSSLTAMGFEAEAASEALAASGNDLDKAVVRLLSPSPHDVLEETPDPYRTSAKKRPDPVPNDPNKGHFRDDLPPDADPAEIVDSRVAQLRAMGFNVPDVEAALKASNNDVDNALTLLLNLSDTNGYFHESPHDVLAETPEPYGVAKKRPDPVPNDPNKGNFREGLADDATPGLVIDARLQSFVDMGFSVKDAEAALAENDNDVNAALSHLLNTNLDLTTTSSST